MFKSSACPPDCRVDEPAFLQDRARLPRTLQTPTMPRLPVRDTTPEIQPCVIRDRLLPARDIRTRTSRRRTDRRTSTTRTNRHMPARVSRDPFTNLFDLPIQILRERLVELREITTELAKPVNTNSAVSDRHLDAAHPRTRGRSSPVHRHLQRITSRPRIRSVEICSAEEVGAGRARIRVQVELPCA